MPVSIFQNGEPFNLEKLNDVINAINTLQQKTDLSSSTVTNTIYSGTTYGSPDYSSMKATGKVGAISSIKISFPTGQFNGIPRVTITHRVGSTQPAAGGGFTYWVSGVTASEFTINFTTANPKLITVKPIFDYIAVHTTAVQA